MRTYAKYFIIYIILFVGAIGHLIDATFNLIVTITPLTLFLLGAFVLYHTVRRNGVAIILWATGVFVFTLSLEVIGVQTGLVFGGYIYGSVLKPVVLGVPLIIGLNWVFVILGAASIVERITSKTLTFALLTGIFTVAFDFVLEPVAIELNYWTWESGYVPVQNYIAWFGISFISAIILKRFQIKFYSPVAMHYLIAQTLFFTTLYTHFYIL